MVCKKCEKMLGPSTVPDKWKEGSRIAQRKIRENKMLSAKNRFNPLNMGYF
jgi:hypothetical protein